jgi:hypothetical protein
LINKVYNSIGNLKKHEYSFYVHQPHIGHELNDAGADQAYFIGDVQKGGSKTPSGFISNLEGGGVQKEICLQVLSAVSS